MSGQVLAPGAARRVFLLLTGTRWFPVGLVVGILVLLQLERGLTVAQALSAGAVSGAVVLVLELPTSSIGDVLGRRPLYVVAAVVNVAAALTYLFAQSFAAFVLAAALMGVFRALDSGPLEAWFVDTVHASEPEADVDGALSAQGTVLGGSVAAGALLSGALVAWHPLGGGSALVLPFVLFVALDVVHLVAVLALMREPARHPGAAAWRRVGRSVRAAPGVVVDGLRLVRHNRVLAGLLLVEPFWALAMVVFENLQPVRLAQLLGSEERAGAWMGAVAAGGWAVFALGSTAAGLASRRLGVARTAMLARVLNGLGAVVMGLVLGPVALVVAYLATYALHGAANPVHAALLHREARAGNRATVLSMNSMTSYGALAVAGPVVGLVATQVSVQVAMVAAALLSVVGAACYLPARRRERDRLSAPATGPAPDSHG